MLHYINSLSKQSLSSRHLLNPYIPSLVIPSSLNSNPTLVTSTIPFTSLSPSNKTWVIQGRVVAKTNIHEYNNQRESGKLFGFDLVSASGDESHISMFN